MLGYGPVQRWIVGLKRAIREQRQQTGRQRKGTQFLLLIFATMHPAPWLLIIGIPLAIYQVLFDPLRWMWLRIIVGAVIAVGLLVFYDSKKAGGTEKVNG